MASVAFCSPTAISHALRLPALPNFTPPSTSPRLRPRPRVGAVERPRVSRRFSPVATAANRPPSDNSPPSDDENPSTPPPPSSSSSSSSPDSSSASEKHDIPQSSVDWNKSWSEFQASGARSMAPKGREPVTKAQLASSSFNKSWFSFTSSLPTRRQLFNDWRFWVALVFALSLFSSFASSMSSSPPTNAI